MSWVALSPRWASPSTAEMGRAASFATPEAPNGEIRPWTDDPAPNGSYTVDPDCTGSFFDADGTHSNNVVVVDGGKRFFVLSQAQGTTVMEEGIRLDEKDKD